MPRENGAIDNELLLDALLSLPEEQFEAVTRRDVLGHPYEEVAAGMGIPVERAQTHVIQGRIALRQTIFG